MKKSDDQDQSSLLSEKVVKDMSSDLASQHNNKNTHVTHQVARTHSIGERHLFKRSVKGAGDTAQSLRTREPTFGTQHPHGGSHLPVTPVPGDVVPSHTHISRQNTNVH